VISACWGFKMGVILLFSFLFNCAKKIQGIINYNYVLEDFEGILGLP
jgi:hypothetical protein